HPLPHPHLLVGQHNHLELLQPASVQSSEEEAGGLALHWLGCVALLVLEGGLLYCTCPEKSTNYSACYTAAVSQPRSDDPRKNY
ncbi:hypothetical protein KIL84_019553, partial [Mauremys mutica]